MTLPNVFIVGAMKAGTTWLSYNLSSHPQVFIPKRELHYFNNPKIVGRNEKWYKRQFAKAGEAKAIGEKTAGYLLGEEIPKRISDILPDAKIIIVLRDPVKRAISQINHHIRYANIPFYLDPNNFINSDFFLQFDQEYAILERGRYLPQIQRYYNFFAPAQVLILINELDIKKNAKETLVKICHFLEIDPSYDFPLKDQKIHANRSSKMGAFLAYHISMIRPLITKVDRFIPGNKVPPFTTQSLRNQKNVSDL